MIKRENILITGSSGFVGKVLVKELVKTNANLFLVSRDKKFKCVGTKVFYGDLSDKRFCKKIVKNIDTVYYLAGYKKNIAHHTKYPCDFVLGNVEPLISFLNSVKTSQIKKILYLSSTNVGLYKEGETDGYVVGKYINELLLKAFSKQHNIDIKIVRSAGIYGPEDNFNPETANFIPAMINKVYKREKEFLVWGSGKRRMQFIFVDDLVSNLVKIVNDKEDFFVLGNSEILTVNQIAKEVVDLSRVNTKIKNDKTKPDKPSQLWKFNNIIKPKLSFKNGLKKTIEYYKKSHA